LITTIKKIFSLVQLRKKGIFPIFLLVLVSLFLETLGVGLIVPVFAIVTDVNFLTTNPLLGTILNKVLPASWFLDSYQLIFSRKQIVFGTAIFVLFVYIFKALFSIYIHWIVNNFILKLKLGLSNKFFSGYLHSPYSFHLGSNSAYLNNNILRLYEIAGGIEYIFFILAETAIAVGIVSLLFFSEFYAALAVTIILPLSAYYIFYVTKKNLFKWGEQSHMHGGKRLKTIHEVFRGIKDLKILGREKKFLDIFDFHTDRHVHLIRNEKITQLLPRYSLELVFVFSLFVILFFLIGDKPNTNMIPILALFAAAAFRLMPSVNRIVNNFQKLRSLAPIVNLLEKEFKEIVKTNSLQNSNKTISFDSTIYLEKICFKYAGASKKLFSDLTLSISSGSQIGFVGDSGSGKTTLIDLIIGLLSPNDGSIKIDGQDIKQNLRSWQKQIGYVPQAVFLTDDTIRNNVAFGVKESEISEDNVLEAIELSQLSEFVAGLPDGLNTMVGENGAKISGGQRQRIGIARALYHKPKVLVLDEATSSLDLETEAEIVSEINKFKGKKTMLIVSHSLSTVSMCDQLFKLDKGKIVKQNNK